MIELSCFALVIGLLPSSSAAPAPVQPADTSSQLTLDQAVAEAIEHNLDLLAERASVPVAEARVITAGLRPNPVVSLSADHLDLAGSRFTEDNGAGPTELSLRTDVLFERGGKRAIRIQEAEAARSVAELELRNSVRTLAFSVQSAFVDLLLAQEKLALANQNLKSMTEIVDVNVTRVRAGDLSETELARTRVAASQLHNTVRQAALSVRTAQNRLAPLLGRSAGAGGMIATGQFRADANVLSVAELQTSAETRRPDLQALRTEQGRSAADLRLQLAQGKIDYIVGAEFRRQQGINGKGNSLGVFLSAPLPLFNRNQGEISRAERESVQAEIRTRALITAVTSEVDTAYEQYLTSRSLVQSIEQEQLRPARDVRDATEYSYRRGEANFVEFLDAERTFNDTMDAYLEARAEYARSLYLIDSACGRDMKP